MMVEAPKAWQRKETIAKTRLTVRDNSPANDEFLLERVLSDPKQFEVFKPVHIVIGYNPHQNGHPWPKGCDVHCMSCWYTPNYLQTQPTYLSSIKETTVAGLGQTLTEVSTKAAQKAEAHFDRSQLQKRVVRLSGDVLGDPLMADPEMCQAVCKEVKQTFADQVEIQIDTVGNQKILEADEWKQLGVDTVVFSVNVVSDETSYQRFHGTPKGSMARMEANVKNCLKAGLKVIFSYVTADHPRNSAEVKQRVPKFWSDGQTSEARHNFYSRLGIENPLERFWRIHLPPDETQKQALYRHWENRAQMDLPSK